MIRYSRSPYPGRNQFSVIVSGSSSVEIDLEKVLSTENPRVFHALYTLRLVSFSVNTPSSATPGSPEKTACDALVADILASKKVEGGVPLVSVSLLGNECFFPLSTNEPAGISSDLALTIDMATNRHSIKRMKIELLDIFSTTPLAVAPVFGLVFDLSLR